MARSLNVSVGDELIVLSQTTDGGIANDLYAVRGILGSINDGVDRGAVYLTEDAFRELFVMPSGAHEIVVRKRTTSSWMPRSRRRRVWPPVSTRSRGGR